MKYGLDQTLTEKSFEIVVYQENKEYGVYIIEKSIYSNEDTFQELIGYETTKHDAEIVQDNAFDYMSYHGFTKLSKRYSRIF